MSAVRKISKASRHPTERKVIFLPLVSETSIEFRKSILKREVALVTGFERKLRIATWGHSSSGPKYRVNKFMKTALQNRER